MSGHSKWRQIKRKKEVTDSKRGQIFTRLATQIKQAARAGKDPGNNPALAEAITRAKCANMPQANIDRLLDNTGNTHQEEVTYEAFGPGGAAIILIAHTDNGRRTVAELRTILKNHGATMGTPGSVTWKFQQNKSGQLTPNYTIAISGVAADKLTALISALEQHPDIEQVVTDAVK